jgi:antitoxin (DNA-binding transcriptional repressor) of toxin-antitoxin stability system
VGPIDLRSGLNSLHNRARIAFMKKASITEAKNNLSALIDGLANSSPVLIMDRGRPVARLEPVAGTGNDTDEDRLARLARKGIVRPRRVSLSPDFFKEKLPRPRKGASVVEALLDERRNGR